MKILIQDITHVEIALLFRDFWVPEQAREVRAVRVRPSLLGHPNARIAREFRA
jgi:hypothetical protein